MVFYLNGESALKHDNLWSVDVKLGKFYGAQKWNFEPCTNLYVSLY